MRHLEIAFMVLFLFSPLVGAQIEFMEAPPVITPIPEDIALGDFDDARLAMLGQLLVAVGALAWSRPRVDGIIAVGIPTQLTTSALLPLAAHAVTIPMLALWLSRRLMRSSRLHAGRITGGDCHHRFVGSTRVAGCRSCSGSSTKYRMQKQLAPDRYCHDDVC